MHKRAYFECFAGASGDMLLAALLGIGIDKEWFIGELKKLHHIKDDFEINISTVTRKGIAATDVEVKLTHHEHHHRGLSDIINIINSSDIEENAKELAVKIFTNLAKAEAKVHNIDIEKVHFHEVGAIDAIVDISGFAILFSGMDIDKVIVSPVNTGTGFVECAHGTMPVPAPATLEIIQSSIWPIDNSTEIKTELLTPTGAAILATIKDEYGNIPAFKKISSISYGAGKKETPKIANVVRLIIGEINEQEQSDAVWMIETNIDDMQPEFYDFVFEKLLEAGALDVFLTPVIMKKNRPANVLSVLCNDNIKDKIEEIILTQTTTLGIRSYKVNRTMLDREIKTIDLDNLGKVRIKIAKDQSGKILSIKPEYEDCAKLARENNISLKEIYNLVNRHL